MAAVGMEEAILEAVSEGEDILEADISGAEGGAAMATVVLDTIIMVEVTMAEGTMMATSVGRIMKARITEMLTPMILQIMDTPLRIMGARMVMVATHGAGTAGTDITVMVIMVTTDGTALDGKTGQYRPVNPAQSLRRLITRSIG